VKTWEMLAAQEALFSTPFVNYNNYYYYYYNCNKDLTAEIHRVWNVKTKVIPVITGETGTIPKSFI
jgi:3'-phosphoadenosine 5'-phosphosulfate sulfotransferase (PAPS reductase)/FAD synthetase